MYEVIRADKITVPRTEGRYHFNRLGHLYDNLDGQLIAVTNQSEEKYNLAGTVYANNFSLLELFALTYKPLYIPFEFINKVKLTLRTDVDGLKGFGLVNFIWKFIEPVKSFAYNGFRYIPGFTRYVINEEGVIISTLTGQKLSTHISSVGYPSVRIVNDCALSAIMSVHTLIALAFCTYGDNVCSLVVDHLNGDKTDNHPSNLEWVSSGENNRRAILHGLKNKQMRKVICKDLLSKQITTHESPSAVAKFLNVRNSSIFEYLNRINHNTAFKQQFLLWYSDIPYPFDENNISREGSQPRKLLVKNVVTGNIVEYVSVADFLKSSNLTRKQVYGNLEKNNQKVYGDLVFKYSDDYSDWVI